MEGSGQLLRAHHGPLVQECIKPPFRRAQLNLYLIFFFCFSDFHKVGGFEIFEKCISHEEDEVRWKLLELAATLSQNNPYCQQVLLQDPILNLGKLLDVLDNDPSDTVRTKALYAISCKNNYTVEFCYHACGWWIVHSSVIVQRLGPFPNCTDTSPIPTQ